MMMINTDTMLSITEANQNFSKVAKVVDKHGSAVIMKNNAPKYLILEFPQAEENQTASTEEVMALSKRFINQNREAYEVLAK